MRETISWNRDWQFVPKFTEKLLSDSFREEAVLVDLPHTTKETPLHYFDESSYQMVCGYRREFTADPAWKGKRVLLTVMGAAHEATVFINGTELLTHSCGYTAFQVDLADYLKYGEKNVLVIRVDSRESLNVPPFGYVIDYMTFGGLYREVYLDILPKQAIKDVFVKVDKADVADKSQKVYTICPEVTLFDEPVKAAVLRFTIYNKERKQIKIWEENLSENQNTEKRQTEAGAEWTRKTEKQLVEGVTEWDTVHPELYTLCTELVCGGEVLDRREDRFGFRTVRFQKDGFYLNGKKVKLRGLNRHQSYPYVGYAMPKSMQEFDAEVLKNELGLNAVRTSHYPQSKHFINRCDELGLLVFTEMPGWQHIGNEEWKKQAVKNVEEMVLQYRNHPSIILWGVRINESQDDDEFYKRTNAVAHQLDETRQTSGVRCFTNSSLLEDVYAFNDFSHEGNNAGCKKRDKVTKHTEQGYLISEYNGHMFPTKAFDNEDHRVEHLLRHAKVVDAYYGEENIAGGFGWCMFDYNTHKDFGSGDRICYHGVCDMFRNLKPAAYVYQSQSENEDTLFISSTMDIGEHPACLMKDVYAVTNADSVRVYKNDEFVREFKKEETPFVHMPHGPILIDDFIGGLMGQGEGYSKSKSDDVKKVLMSACKNGMENLPLSTKLLAAKCVIFRGMSMQDAVELYNKYIGNWGGTATVYRFDAIKDGKVVKSVVKKPMKERKLVAQTSATTLYEAETYDVAAVRIQMTDENGEVLPVANLPVTLEVSGEAKLIGPAVISLNGGMGGTYVKTTGKEGTATLTIRCEEMEPVRIEYRIMRKNA